MEYRFRNVNDGFRRILSDIQERTLQTENADTRNGTVWRCTAPVLWSYERPWERVLFNQARDANPFFHVFEALWMLSGSNDVAPVSHYCRRMLDFSDDGETLHDAYGYRWRHQFKYDQLEHIIGLLQSQPDTRRATLSMWDGHVDLLRTVYSPMCKAVPCNTHAYFQLRKGALDMTVCNRSNDLVWGAFGANAVHFSFLQEYIAASLRRQMGSLHHFTNDLHLYTNNMSLDKWLEDKTFSAYDSHCGWNQVPLVSPEDDLRTFDKEIKLFVEDPTGNYCSTFLREVACPMMRVWEAHKAREYDLAVKHLICIKATDWQFAADTWISKRRKLWENDDK